MNASRGITQGRFINSLHRQVRLVVAGWLLSCAVTRSLGSDAAESALAALNRPGHVLLLRHANAPGVGDPDGMVLGDCATQRNLDARGRAQAKALGERLRAAGLSDVRVFTSQWCRCRDTARLLDIGSVEELPALNSFFGETAVVREARLTELRAFLAALPRDGRAVVLVTHQLTITGLTGYFPGSGEGLAVRLGDGEGFERVAELPASATD